MNDEMKQFAEMLLNSLQSMEVRLATRMDTMIEEMDERFDTIESRLNAIEDKIDILMESTEKTAIKVSFLDNQDQLEIKQYIEEEKAWRVYTETRLKRLK
jgi:hypothetical protein